MKLISLGFLSTMAFAATLECPILECAAELDINGPITPDICFKHDNKQPVKTMTEYPCKWYMDNDKTTNSGPVTCEFDLRTGEYAWLNERY